MDVGHQLLAGVGTLGLVVAEEDGDGVDREGTEEGVALEASDRGGDGQVLQLLLVGDGTLQPVLLPLRLGDLHHAEEAGVPAGPAGLVDPAGDGLDAGQERGGSAMGGAGGEGGHLVVALLAYNGQTSGESAPEERLVELEVESSSRECEEETDQADGEDQPGWSRAWREVISRSYSSLVTGYFALSSAPPA